MPKQYKRNIFWLDDDGAEYDKFNRLNFSSLLKNFVASYATIY